MSAELLGLLAGSVLSLAFAYIPKLKTWFSGKTGTTKRLVLASVMLVLSIASMGLACWAPDTVIKGLQCSQAGVLELAGVFILTVIANQGTYSLAVKS